MKKEKMQRRFVKLIVGKAGGTASANAKTYKICLPTDWVEKMNLTNTQIDMRYDDGRILIEPHLPLNEYLTAKKTRGHKLMLIDFYDNDNLCTEICADFTDKTLSATNYTDNIIKTAFGNNDAPVWQDLQDFLEERCVPRSRSGIREFLEAMGIEEYDPLEIIKKTRGIMAEDHQWIKLEEV